MNEAELEEAISTPTTSPTRTQTSFLDFNGAEFQSFLHGNAPVDVWMADQARQRRTPLSLSRSTEETPEGSQLEAKISAFLAEMGPEWSPFLFRRGEEGVEHWAYVHPNGENFFSVASEPANDKLHRSAFMGLDGALYEQWRAALSKFITKEKVRRSRSKSTQIHTLAGSPARGYSLNTCGWEKSRLIYENYTPETQTALRDACKEIVREDPRGRLLLLEGPPGTGKTRALRGLISSINDEATVAVVPPHMVAELSGPDLIGALIGHGMVILVIEDADYALLDRESRSDEDRKGSTGALSSILNLSDGILGAHINIRIVATTNQPVAHLDAAVLRPGRLLDRVSFNLLSEEAARAFLARQLKRELERGRVSLPEHIEGRTLAELYETARKLKLAARSKPATP